MTVGDGGSFSPGASPGPALTGPTIWDTGGTYVWEINALAGFGGTEGDDPGWDLWHTELLTIDGPFAIAPTTLTAANDPGLLANWDASSNQQWRIATSSNSAFLSLADLSLDLSDFQNSLGGGTFSLSASVDGSELYLDFASIPEPSNLTYVTFATLLMLRRGRTCRTWNATI